MNIFFLMIIGTVTATCTIPRTIGKDEHSPVILNNKTQIFPLRGAASPLSNGDKLQLLCPGRRNQISATRNTSLTVHCRSNQFCNTNIGCTRSIENLLCRNTSESSTRKTGERCNGNNVIIEIGYKVEDFSPLIRVCFNETNLGTSWTRHQYFYGSSSTINAHFNFQNDHIGTRWANLYRNTGYDRGHLSPNADFYSYYDKKATYYYINVIPQVKDFNQNNWKYLEELIRTEARSSKRDLTIYTGVMGVLDYLGGRSRKIPVPKYSWKIVIDARGRGLAFVGHNFLTGSRFELCRDVCDEIPWIRGNFAYNRLRQDYGYMYCCDIPDFRRIRNIHLPRIPEYRSGRL